jgi:hypothetical protein
VNISEFWQMDAIKLNMTTGEHASLLSSFYVNSIDLNFTLGLSGGYAMEISFSRQSFLARSLQGGSD